MKHYSFVDYATQGYTLLVGVVVLVFHNATVPRWPWIVAAHGAILIAVHALILVNQRIQGAASLTFLRHFYPVALYLWFFSQTGWLNRMFFSEYMDPTIIRWEQALFGCQPSVVFMEKLPYLPISEIFYASYFSYYIMIVGIGIALYAREPRQFYHYVSVISFVFYFCYALYILLPIIGPRVFFHDVAGYSLPEAIQQLAPTDTFPRAVQKGPFFHIMGFIYGVFEAPGAALPSSHVAIALATVFFSFRYLRRIRFLHLTVAILLCLSTIYCRYHYALDVLLGALTALVLVPLANWLYFKSVPGVPPASGTEISRTSERCAQLCGTVWEAARTVAKTLPPKGGTPNLSGTPNLK
jgi:membrane-associated phospholipid phosphatase